MLLNSFQTFQKLANSVNRQENTSNESKRTNFGASEVDRLYCSSLMILESSTTYENEYGALENDVKAKSPTKSKTPESNDQFAESQISPNSIQSKMQAIEISLVVAEETVFFFRFIHFLNIALDLSKFILVLSS